MEVVGQILLPHQEAEGRIQEACHRDLAQAVEITEGKGLFKISYFLSEIKLHFFPQYSEFYRFCRPVL